MKNTQKSSNKALLFITVTYAITAVFHIGLQVMGGSSNAAATSLLAIPMLFPFLSMTVVMLLYKQPFPRLRSIRLRFNRWHLAAILAPLLIVIIQNWTGALFPVEATVFKGDWQDLMEAILIGVTIASISAWFEEVAWRGYLHKQLEAFSMIKRYAIVGAVWSVWHLPTALWYKYQSESAEVTILFLAQLFILSFLISYIRERSQSIVAAALIHGMINAVVFTDLFIWFSDGQLVQVEWIRLLSCVVAVVGLIFIFEKTKKAAARP